MKHLTIASQVILADMQLDNVNIIRITIDNDQLMNNNNDDDN